MSDSNIIKVKTYLNNMYGHRSDWVMLDDTGYTGSLLCQGIIRAFQIENGISSITGIVGNETLTKMRSLEVISKMSPDDTPNPNVCILQCALFAKGYNAGGITGIFYNAGVSAVKSYQEDANLDVTGEVDWKVWMGLVSLNWFTKTSSGDSNIVTIQKQLNADWSDIIGVGPCDGVVSRATAYALIAALQAAEGIYSDFMGTLDGTNFGELTTAKFPAVLKFNQNGVYVKYNKLVQYGLYFNGFNPKRFDGIFDETTKEKVAEFQKFYALTDINLVTEGEVNVSTMKSLLTSKGDTARSAKACDCATVLNEQQALDLKNAGYTHVGRYLTGYVGSDHIPKSLTLEEIANIEKAGLSVFLIYQDGGYYFDYFKDATQGTIDAETAMAAAARIGAPNGSIIYFSVDFDCYSYQVYDYILPYFNNVRMSFNSISNAWGYKIGVYGPRYLCTLLSEAGITETSFVSDMSSGFSCNLGYKIPENWAFDQFYETSFSSTPSFAIDKDAYSGRDTGISAFDEVPYLSEEELENANRELLLEIALKRYVYYVMGPLGYLSKFTEAGIQYNTEIPLATYDSDTVTVELTGSVSKEFTKPSDYNYNIPISLDESGELSAGFQSDLLALSTEIGKINFEGMDQIKELENITENLSSIALSVKDGNILFETAFVSPNCVEFSIIVTSEDVLPNVENIDASVSISLNFTLTLKPDSNKKFNEVAFVFSTEEEIEMAKVLVGATAVVCTIAIIASLSSLTTAVAITSLVLALNSAGSSYGGVISDKEVI